MNPMPTKRALLIGIDAYPNVLPLDGCVNDARLMQSVLVEHFGFPADHITLLANGQATRDGILSAFDALVSATGADDIVVVHYSGHGSQMADREGDEPSGFDSTIVPFDAARPGDVPDITDDEINLRIEALARKDAVYDVDLRRLSFRDGHARRLRPARPIDRSRYEACVGPAGLTDSARATPAVAGRGSQRMDAAGRQVRAHCRLPRRGAVARVLSARRARDVWCTAP